MSGLDLDALRCEVEALQAERDTARVEAGRLRESLRVLTREHDALITRLRAAEARTAWQPIETAPLWPDRSPTPLWIVGQRVARPPVTVAQTAPGVYVDEYGHRQHVTAWAPLPAAPEAP